jgi:ABC-type glycerol-3-phosphate transport system substrate-binding protein
MQIIPQQWMRRDAIANDQVKAVELFATGQGAMFYTGTWNIGDIVDMKPNFEFDFFLLPVGNNPADTKMCVQTDQVFMVNPKAQNAQEGVQFMEYWITEGGMYWSEKSAMPLTSGALSDKLHPAVKALAEIKKSGNFIHLGDFDVPLNNEFNTVWRRALMAMAESQLTNGGMTAAQVIANAQKGFDDARATR